MNPYILAWLAAWLALVPSAQADPLDGAKVYADSNCAACHQPNGSGVPGAYPALVDQPIVAGDPDVVIKIVLIGPEKVLPPGGPKYSGQMPPIVGLSDAKLAALITFIRDKFGKGASAVDEDEVAKVRASLTP